MKKENTFVYADEVVVKAIATQVLVIGFIAITGQWEYPFLFLAIDFFLRAFTRLPSPLAVTGKTIARVLRLKPKRIFAAPKRFAASLGFVFSIIAFLFLALQWYLAAYITGSVLIFCALLESAFGICLGCYVFNFVVVPLKSEK